MSKVSVREKKNSVTLKNRFYEITVNLRDGTWSAKDRMTNSWGFRDAGFRVDRHGVRPWPEPQTRITWRKRESKTRLGRRTTLVVTFTPAAGYDPIRILHISLYPDASFIEIGWGVRNRFEYPVRIRNVEAVYCGSLFDGQELAEPRVLRSGAGAESNVVEKGWQIEALNGALLTYKDSGKRRSLVAGGLLYAEFAKRVELLDGRKVWGNRATSRMEDKGSRNITLAFWDPQGKIVQSGTTYMSPDTFYLDFATSNPFEALEAYGEALRTANNANPNVYDFPTLCGWMVSTKWLGEDKPINNSVGLVEQTRIARAKGLMNYTPLAVRLEPDNYCYGGFGDTQQGWWDDEHWSAYGPGHGGKAKPGKGSLRKPYETFRKFCGGVAKLGGIPFTYFQCSMPSNDFARTHPDWMLKGDISELHYHHAHHRPLIRYDYTHKGFRAHCLRVWKRLRKAGLKGVKFDYPETAWASSGGFDDESFTTTSAYRELFRLCREGLGKDAFIHERILGGMAHESVPCLDANVGIVDLQRVWGDASHFEAEMASRMGLRWYKSRRVFLYYPDGKSFYHGGKPLPAYKRRAFLTIIAFLSGRLEIGTSIGSMTDEMFHDTTRLFPMLGGEVSPRPVDMLIGGTHPSVYVFDVTDTWKQVLLINNAKRGRKTISAPLAGDQAETGSLGMNAKAKYHAFDFWNQQYLGSLKGSGRLSVSLRAGEAAMISVRRAERRPQIISTNRHIMQGMMECHDVSWSGAKCSLTGTVDVVGGEDFVLTVACNGHRPSTCEGAAIRKRGRGLVDLVFSSEQNARMAFNLRFSR